MSAALLQPRPEIEVLEELLEDDQAAKGSQLIAGSEFDAWNLPAAGVDGASGNVHKWWPFVWGWSKCGNNDLPFANQGVYTRKHCIAQGLIEAGEIGLYDGELDLAPFSAKGSKIG